MDSSFVSIKKNQTLRFSSETFCNYTKEIKFKGENGEDNWTCSLITTIERKKHKEKTGYHESQERKKSTTGTQKIQKIKIFFCHNQK